MTQCWFEPEVNVTVELSPAQETFLGALKQGESPLLRPEPSAEVRHTSATGGQKGRKAETYRLIPEAFDREVERQSLPRTNAMYVRFGVEAFWGVGPIGHRSARSLVYAAGWAEAAMGGRVATRYHVAKVYGLGALKYDDDNWKRGYPWSWSYDALHRHLEAIRRGELIDPESGVCHWAHVWWHCATLWTFATEKLGTDDRPVKKEVA